MMNPKLLTLSLMAYQALMSWQTLANGVPAPGRAKDNEFILQLRQGVEASPSLLARMASKARSPIVPQAFKSFSKAISGLAVRVPAKTTDEAAEIMARIEAANPEILRVDPNFLVFETGRKFPQAWRETWNSRSKESVPGQKKKAPGQKKKKSAPGQKKKESAPGQKKKESAPGQKKKEFDYHR
ncbi:hypothetical protein DUNSADRAFT_9326, partial [Dunaliella salina]